MEPARLAGYRIDDALVEVLITDATSRPTVDGRYEASVLPMLSHTMQALVDVYRADKAAAHRLFLRLVRVERGMPDTRTRLPRQADVARRTAPAPFHTRLTAAHASIPTGEGKLAQRAPVR